MAIGGIPVVLVDNGTPITPSARGIPVTIVGGNASIVEDGAIVPLQNQTGSDRGTVTASTDPLTVSLPQETDIVTDGDSKPVLNEAGDTTLATGTAKVPISVFDGLKLPADNAVVNDGASVSINAPDGTIPATIAVAGNAVTAVNLTDGTDTIVSDGMTLGIEPTGTFTSTVTFTVTGGVITAINLS